MADAYTVLARRYRSQTFDELVGQEAVAQTLKNAIRTGRVAHAFIFTGTRGVGKTSAARILAKAVNCPNRAPDGNPCGVCETCKAIARGEDMDVIEIDGASNNSVDQIRELRQSAGIRPAKSPYKIYIIDEVHMLSGGAFNALLKTLEEPPEHVKFIFATTDIHKVPATIISRCQRFDFKNIPTQRIAEHLTEICKDEKVAADADALFRVARLGNGSMRDALSILDRVLSMGEKRITDKILEELLGKPPTQAIGNLVEAIANADAGAAMTLADALLKEGMGVEQVLSELVEFLRNLMIVATCGEKTDLLEVAAEARGRFTALAQKFDAPTLVHLMALAEQTLRSLKSSTMQRPLFDALIVRLALSEQFSSIRQILASSEKSPPPANPPIAGQKKK
jgi:DNA polymerase-3 subunit gamma/tau